MSANRKYLERCGWRLWSRKKHGMYIKELWYHPRDGSRTYNQQDAVAEQRRFNKERKANG